MGQDGKTGAPERASREDPALGYAELSTRPLHVLIFLLPLVVACELGTLAYLTGDDGRVRETVSAYLKLTEFFEVFGAFGLYLPGLALVTVLFVQHLLRRDPWRVRAMVPIGMVVESVALIAPLLVFGLMLGHGPATGASAPAAAGATGGVLAGTWEQRATIALAAGLYEELLFRMVLIAIVHALAVDVIGMKHAHGTILAVLISALAFAAYHDVRAGAGVDLLKAGFYAVAGLYFGALFVWRGFGIAVGVHIAYDMVVLLLINRHGGG